MESIGERIAYAQGFKRAQMGKSHAHGPLHGLLDRLFDGAGERTSRERGFQDGVLSLALEDEAAGGGEIGR
jgi:hypothetical protein